MTGVTKRSKVAEQAELDIREMKKAEKEIGDKLIALLNKVDLYVRDPKVSGAMSDIEDVWCEMMDNTQALVQKSWNYR